MNVTTFFIAGAAALLVVSLSAAQEVLPRPEEAFQDAKIGRTYQDSTPGTISLQPSALGASDHQTVRDMERAAALTIE
jgi:hypothetical protein